LPCHQDLQESDMCKIVEIVEQEWDQMNLNRCALSGDPGVLSLREHRSLTLASKAQAG
jgi:hypothetical protein